MKMVERKNTMVKRLAKDFSDCAGWLEVLDQCHFIGTCIKDLSQCGGLGLCQGALV